MKKCLLIVISLFIVIGITSCSPEKRKENRVKYEQQKLMTDFGIGLKIMEPFLERMFVSMNMDANLNVEMEAMPNQTMKFTLECIVGENDVYNGKIDEDELEDSKREFLKLLYSYIERGNSFVVDIIIKQGDTVLEKQQFTLSPEDLPNVNVSIK